jgi:hypothetical protein
MTNTHALVGFRFSLSPPPATWNVPVIRSKNFREPQSGKSLQLRHRGIIRSIEMARPMTSTYSGFEDQIGSGETDLTISNRAGRRKVCLIPIIHPNGTNFKDAGTRESKNSVGVKRKRDSHQHSCSSFTKFSQTCPAVHGVFLVGL